MATPKIPTPKTPTTRTKEVRQEKKTTIKKRPISSSTTKKITLPTPPSRVATLQKHKTATAHKGLSNITKILVVAIIGLMLWAFKDNIISYIGMSTQKEQLIINQGDDVLFVGKDIELTGIPQKISSRRLNYTHTIEDSTYGTLGLRSSSIDLNALSGSTKLQGKIIDFTNNIYIVDITQAEMLSQDQENNAQKLLYFPRPGLLIQNMTAEGFTITNQETTGTSSLIVRNPSTNAQVTIRYFACSTDQAYDCTRFQKTFESTVGVHFTDSYKNKFYKLKDANTRFVNLDNRYGIYIETSSESLLTMIIKNIQFITNDRAKTTLTPLAKTLCIGSGYTLNEVTEGTISYEHTNTIWNIQGVSQNYEPMTCSLSINPLELGESSLISLGKKQGVVNQETVKPIEQETSQQTEETTTNATISLSNTNNVAQIPLKPGKELLFSTKGLSISFPSPNIAFESSNSIKTIKGLSCTTSTNVTLYSNKVNVKTNPSIVMYFCKNGSPTDTSNVRVITTANTTILIEILDPAWVDFINGIKIN